MEKFYRVQENNLHGIGENRASRSILQSASESVTVPLVVKSLGTSRIRSSSGRDIPLWRQACRRRHIVSYRNACPGNAGICCEAGHSVSKDMQTYTRVAVQNVDSKMAMAMCLRLWSQIPTLMSLMFITLSPRLWTIFLFDGPTG